MFLTCPEEVIRFVGGTIQSALAQPAVAAILRERPTSFRFGVVDPDCVLYVDPAAGQVRFSSTEDGPSAIVAMRGDTALALCQGRLDVHAALRDGEIVASEDLEPIFELISAAAGLPAIYADLAQREGRVDLLAS